MKAAKAQGIIKTVEPAIAKRAEGGRIVEAGGNPHVFDAVKARKFGGRAVSKIAGASSRPRLDRPGRKVGGRVGANTAPLSTAAKAV